ncbi:MAG: hypothetical protein KF724_05125 [Phycisphaeraceae bacterium]|nr:hypothetical protein [Phycisphaeraceae bacterium]
MEADPTQRPAELAATLAPLGEPIEGLQWIAESGFRGVQLSAAQPGMRPRELDAGARRGLRETLRRLDLLPAGLDLWIPPAHFIKEQEVARAVDAMFAALAFAEALGRISVSCVLPPPSVPARGAIVEEAARRGVRLADFALEATAEEWIGLGFDLAICRERHADPVEAIARAGAALAAVRMGEVTPDGRRTPIEPGGASAHALGELRVALALGAPVELPVADARGWSDPRAGLRSTLAAWRGDPPPA